MSETVKRVVVALLAAGALTSGVAGCGHSGGGARPLVRGITPSPVEVAAVGGDRTVRGQTGLGSDDALKTAPPPLVGTGASGVTMRRWGSGTAARLTVIGLLAAAVSGVLVVVGRRHSPDYGLGLFGQTGLSSLALKSLLGTVALGLVVLQVVLALWLYRKLPALGTAPRPVRPAHRIGGVALFALTVPIALHCLLAYGVQFTSARVAVHSVAGCLFYGAFAAKVLVVRSRRLPGWTLPAAGAGVGTLFAVVWATSAAWYYTTVQ